MLLKFWALVATLFLFVGNALADEAAIRKALVAKFPEAKIASIQKTPYSGLYEVYMDGQLVYADTNAQYIFLGDVVDLKNRANLTQARLSVLKAEQCFHNTNTTRRTQQSVVADEAG